MVLSSFSFASFLRGRTIFELALFSYADILASPAGRFLLFLAASSAFVPFVTFFFNQQ